MSQSVRSDQEVDRMYQDYRQQAEEVSRRTRRFILPYLVVALVALVISLGGCYVGLFAPSILGLTGYRWAPWIFWIGLLVELAVILVGARQAQKQTYQEAADVARSKPGFAAFFELYYKRRYWPKGAVTGKKRDEFLALIGQ